VDRPQPPGKEEVAALVKEFITNGLHGEAVGIISVSDPMDPPQKETERNPDLWIYAVSYKGNDLLGTGVHSNLLVEVARQRVGPHKGERAVSGYLFSAKSIRELKGDDWYEKEWKGKHHLDDPTNK
jgi:hypothetical protein